MEEAFLVPWNTRQYLFKKIRCQYDNPLKGIMIAQICSTDQLVNAGIERGVLT